MPSETADKPVILFADATKVVKLDSHTDGVHLDDNFCLGPGTTYPLLDRKWQYTPGHLVFDDKMQVLNSSHSYQRRHHSLVHAGRSKEASFIPRST